MIAPSGLWGRVGDYTLRIEKTRAPRNRTITLTDEEKSRYQARLVRLDSPVPVEAILDRRDILLSEIEEMIKDKGEENVLY